MSERACDQDGALTPSLPELIDICVGCGRVNWDAVKVAELEAELANARALAKEWFDKYQALKGRVGSSGAGTLV